MPQLLDTTDVAEATGLSVNTIRMYHKQKKMPPADHFFNRTPVWEKSTIDGWKTHRETVTVTPTPSKEI